MTTVPSVIFDLDGTLVDSTKDIANSLNRVLAPFGAKPLSVGEVVPLIGEGSAHLVAGAVRTAEVSVPDERELTAAYLADYRAHPLDDTVLYEGVVEALSELASAGVPMAVCTNKTESIAQIVLDGLQIGRYFGAVVGSDRPVQSKPHAEHLLTAIAELGCDPATSVLVGDTVIDQRCARAASVAFLAVPWASPEVDGERLGTFADLPATVLEGRGPTIARSESR